MAGAEEVEVCVAIEVTGLAAIIRGHQNIGKAIHPQHHSEGCARVGVDMSWIIPEFGTAVKFPNLVPPITSNFGMTSVG